MLIHLTALITVDSWQSSDAKSSLSSFFSGNMTPLAFLVTSYLGEVYVTTILSILELMLPLLEMASWTSLAIFLRCSTVSLASCKFEQGSSMSSPTHQHISCFVWARELVQLVANPALHLCIYTTLLALTGQCGLLLTLMSMIPLLFWAFKLVFYSLVELELAGFHIYSGKQIDKLICQC